MARRATVSPRPDDRPALVAVHGFADSGACMVPFLRRLGEPTALTPNLLAHGGRPMPPVTPFSHTTLVADLVPTVRAAAQAAGGPIVLLGHSLGATTAAGVAADAPDLVRGLVLEDPPWDLPHGGTDDDDAESDNPHRPWLEGLQSTDHAGRLAWVREHNPDWPADEREAWAESKAQVDLALFDAPQEWLRRRWTDVVEQVCCPVLMLVGDPARDAACTQPAATALAQRRGWEVRLVPGAGHNVRREQPEVAVALVRAACDRW